MNLITNLEDKRVIEVFAMNPKEEIMDYKKTYIEKIPFEERLLEAHTDYELPLESEENDVAFYKIQYSSSDHWGSSERHCLIKPRVSEEEYKTLCDSLTIKYINGELAKAKAKRVMYSRVDQLLNLKKTPLFLDNLLITEKYSSGWDLNGGKKMSNILKLTRELFLLQLLESGDFEFASNLKIDEQLSLFDISKIASYNMSDLENLISYGIIKEDSILTKRIEGCNLILARSKNIK